MSRLRKAGGNSRTVQNITGMSDRWFIYNHFVCFSAVAAAKEVGGIIKAHSPALQLPRHCLLLVLVFILFQGKGVSWLY